MLHIAPTIVLTMIAVSPEPASPLQFDPTAVVPMSASNLVHYFSMEGSTHWTANLGGGSDFEDDDFFKGGIGISHFIADDFSVDLELNAMHFTQAGTDATGANLNLLFRWHFLHDEARLWTIYADGGAGMLFTTDDVPAGGSSFNFTPQAGGGVSFDLGEDVRLYLGARWHHVSNARLYDSNPGRDYAMGYAMISWPF
jgi:lipid A 3-O-deacylase